MARRFVSGAGSRLLQAAKKAVAEVNERLFDPEADPVQCRIGQAVFPALLGESAG
ncbi:hypothetical protein ACFSKW_34620 [Nonomuraea mangrovi]|uniref:Uncharacterized protein n=1 Tax=Nonomuraea mangrovi TaxID=2316207 RepID=A0ABW4T3X1_9ACTN